MVLWWILDVGDTRCNKCPLMSMDRTVSCCENANSHLVHCALKGKVVQCILCDGTVKFLIHSVECLNRKYVSQSYIA